MRVFLLLWLIILAVNIYLPLQAEEVVKNLQAKDLYVAYNPATVETISGTIIRIDRYSGFFDESFYRSYLVLRFGSREGGYKYITVHLGPSSFMDKQEVKLAKNDNIEVKGSRVFWKASESEIILAAEITKDGRVMKLRDANGTTVWDLRNKRNRQRGVQY